MIIKSLRHFQRSAQYSVNYLYNGISKNPENQWLIFQNITKGHNRHSIIEELNTNASFLTKTAKRKKVFRYHEVLAFAYENSNPKDLSREKLQHIATEYLKLRDPQGLSKAICVPHIEDGRHYHLHLLMTSNHIESSRSGDMMLNNEQYYSLRREMERYILREMPELHQSTVFLEEKEIQQILPEKYRRERQLMQLEKPTRKKNQTKDKIAELVKEVLSRSNTLEEFEKLLNNTPNFQTYQRNGKLTGVIHERKKKYRFSNLGIPLYKENFRTLKRMSEVEQLQKRSERERDDNTLER